MWYIFWILRLIPLLRDKDQPGGEEHVRYQVLKQNKNIAENLVFKAEFTPV